MLDDIQIVLSHTSHPGNIGSAARAMKTMGLSRLVLVNPKQFPCAEATAMSSGASDILANARVCSSMEDALSGSRLVIGSSARSRNLNAPLWMPREMGEYIAEHPEERPISIVFGRESSGLTNEEMLMCQYHVNIPANPDYSSLNLSQAVQVLCYELRLAAGVHEAPEAPASENLADIDKPVSNEEMELFYEHLQRVMTKTGFFNPDKPKRLLPKLRRLFNRARLTVSEMNILRGFLASVEKPTGAMVSNPGVAANSDDKGAR